MFVYWPSIVSFEFTYSSPFCSNVNRYEFSASVVNKMYLSSLFIKSKATVFSSSWLKDIIASKFELNKTKLALLSFEPIKASLLFTFTNFELEKSLI